eukprot:3351618-Karenia_brevis.AAC.1
MLDPNLLRQDSSAADTPRAPKVWCQDADWPEVARNLIDHGICAVIEEKDGPVVSGVKMLHGLLGVEKPDKPALQDGRCVLRLVMHLACCNVLFKAIEGDMDKLPTAGLWQA